VSAPTKEEQRAVFEALVRNGFDFIARSARELEDDRKFSVAHFATGVELLLKARLFHEHWSLIAAKPHECSWEDLKNGEIVTISASAICVAIEKATSTKIASQKASFKKIFDHRNCVLHFVPRDDIASTVGEHCLAWYYLRTLLEDAWKEVFHPSWKPTFLEYLMKKNRKYLDEKMKHLAPRLEESRRANVLLACPSCELDAAVASSVQRLVKVRCLVCDYAGSAFRSSGATRHLDGSETEEVLDELDPLPLMSGKEMSMYQQDRAHCGACCDNEPSVCIDGDDYVCVICAERFEAVSVCECCNTRWAGWDAESSYYSGCEQCDGFDYDDDKHG
jgi:hypothetical protein